MLQLIDSFAIGGTERQAVQLAGLLRAGSTYHVFIGCMDARGPLYEKAREISFEEIPEFRLKTFYDVNFWMQIRRCVAFLKRTEIGIIHTHDGFERIGVKYQRDVEFDRGGPLVVTDFVISDDQKTFVLNFILAPDFNAEVSLNSVKIIDTSFDDRPVAMIETEVTGAGRVRESCWAVDDWQVSHCYGSAVPTKRLRFTFLGSGTISVTNRISKL